MTESYGILSLLPPAVALGLALWKKQIYPALLLGVWIGWWVLEGWNPLAATGSTITSIVTVFVDSGNTRIILYSLLVGSVLTLMSATGGVEGFVKWVGDRHWVTNRRQAQLVPFFMGILITVESSITSLVAGTVGRPLTDRYRVSREKLAYICDSTSAPICILVPFNGWGAMVIGLLAVQEVQSPVAVLLSSLVWNFYPMVAILVVLFTILARRDVGPMKRAERRARDEGKLMADDAHPLVGEDVLGVDRLEGLKPRAINLALPVLTMILSIVAGIYFTGKAAAPEGAGLWEIIQSSSGSTAVLWAVITSLVVLAILNVRPYFRRNPEREGMSGQAFMDLTFKGMGGMIPVVTLLILAFALGATVRELGTGVYVARIISGVASGKLAVVGLFLLACIMAFATGTSWGTFALMVPIAVPLAAAMDGHLPLYLAAVLGGGVFGDHCSPISDTTIISSMASASDHMDHVQTQIPYALIGAGVAVAFYLVAA
ncbi:MAG: Na+/H+ antiporter NhaC family protein [Fidelibacterota bacterium]|nr:MAG: Na+/H+ antiporter NhaC family protein [Candidatus Neomarinimicrobiota bacterium]